MSRRERTCIPSATPGARSEPTSFRGLRPKIVERGLADEQELDELDRALRRHPDDPDTLVMPHLLFLVWGRKPVV